MTVDEVTALMRWNVAMYANCAKPLSEENAATQITIEISPVLGNLITVIFCY